MNNIRFIFCIKEDEKHFITDLSTYYKNFGSMSFYTDYYIPYYNEYDIEIRPIQTIIGTSEKSYSRFEQSKNYAMFFYPEEYISFLPNMFLKSNKELSELLNKENLIFGRKDLDTLIDFGCIIYNRENTHFHSNNIINNSIFTDQIWLNDQP